MKKALLLCFAFIVLASLGAMAQRTISGKVTDESGEPLLGVNVVIKGTTNGTTTDLEGNYRLQVEEGATLVFSFVGFETQEITVGASSTIDVALGGATELDEVVVVGYGAQLKTELTGNIAKVDGEELRNMPVPNFEQTLQGRASGVFIESSNGKVGQGIKVRIRGASSITADSQPLFVVDGVPITTQNVGNPAEAVSNPLSDINPNDIASVEVLKDASAAAIYGSRAANGVVIITTRSGKPGKTKYNINYQTGVNSPTNRREWLNAEEYVDYILEAAANSDELDGVPTTDPSSWTAFAIGRLDRYSGGTDWRNAEVDTDWEEFAYNDDSRTTKFDLSASGGSEDTRFYVSGSYTDQDGILIGNGLKRLSTRLNLDHSANDRLSFGFNSGFIRTNIDRVSDDNQFSTPIQLIALAPITPVRDSDGNLNDRPVTTYYNGLLDLEGVTRRDVTFRSLLNSYVSFDITDDITFRAEVGADLLTQNQDRRWADYTNGGEGTNGYAISRWARVFNYNTKAYVNYNKLINSNHSIDFTGGFDFQKSETSVTRVEGQEFPVNALKTMASAADIAVGTGTLTEFSFLSYFGRVNYKLNDKYLLTLSGRLDGSSRFGANNQFGFFPAASAGWILSEESFLQGNDIVSFLKLRASYGITGNAGIGNFDALGLYGAEGYAGNGGLQPTQIPNPDLTWEKNSQLDIGFDFGFLNDRINGEIDYYVKTSTDLLLSNPVPGTSGFRIQNQNIGELENRGVEIVLNGVILEGPVSWSSSFNIAFNQNEVTDLGGQQIIDGGSSRTMNVVRVGSAIGAFYGAEYAGVDPATGDALWYLNNEADPRGTTNNFSEAEFVVLGSPNPDYIGGFKNNISWKNFDLNIFFQFVQGNMVHNVGGVFQSAADWFDNPSKEIANRWRQPGDITDVPKAYLAYGNGGQGRSSRFLYDGSYIRLKNLTLGYNLPSDIASRAKLSSARIYFTGVNLLTITDYPLWDPEVSADYLTVNADGSTNNIFQGNDFYSAPQAKTFTVGVQLGF
ncbi:SusC/RagA family TonB-linked outer membrane protein [Ekhidna sp.]|uniref:SusC/RagA family TonB-linked outer membrane protein n=1 Tax=Ekhidna sp. TaxID=2608089 RepID=UPI003CCBC69E